MPARTPASASRCPLTIEDTLEFYNLFAGVKLSEQEKKDLVAFLLCL